MKNLENRIQPHENINRHAPSSSGSDDKSFAKKARTLRFTGAAVLAFGSIALATQQAQALSPLAIVNGITSSGGAGVSKDFSCFYC